MAEADSVDRLADRTTALQLQSASPVRPADLRLQIPNPFVAADEQHGDGDAAMSTASPGAALAASGRLTTAPALPQPPRYAGRTMQDRRDFMREYETYLAAINALQTQWTAAIAMPVGACIEMVTKRMIARWEFGGVAANLVTEEQWIGYFRQALTPTFVDYATVDEAMKGLKMKLKWPEPESRMMQLQADMEVILDKYNITDLAFANEQRRLVKYLADALEPASFRDVVATKLTLQEHKDLKSDVLRFSTYVTELMRGFMTWEHAAQSSAARQRGGGRGGGSSSSGGRGGGASGNSTSRGGARSGGSGGRGGATTNTSDPRASDTKYPRGGCLKCQSTDHQVRECPNVQSGEAERLLKEMHAKRRTTGVRRVETLGGDAETGAAAPSGAVEASVDGLPLRALLLDTGADESLVSEGVVDAIRATGVPVFIAEIKPRTLSPIGGKNFIVRRAVVFREVELTTSAGPLMLRNLACLVEDGNKAREFTLGRPIMTILGYSTDELLVRARDRQPEWELGGSDLAGSEMEAKPTALQRLCRLQRVARDTELEEPPIAGSSGRCDVADTVKGFETVDTSDGHGPVTTPSAPNGVVTKRDPDAAKELIALRVAAIQMREDVERYESRTALPALKTHDLGLVRERMHVQVEAAVAAGLSVEGAERLREILRRRVDTFRLEFGFDPAVRVAPMQVRLKPDALPSKVRSRRYSPDDRAFLDRHTAALLKHGLIYVNHRARWSSAPRIVRKKEQETDPTADPRMTIDMRGVNERTEAMPWPMPVLEVVLSALEGARVFFALDWFRGYWQLPLHPDSQELYTFVTHRGMYTPTRVPMGATDAVAYCQGVVEEIFGDLLGGGILAWLDDILGYAEDEASLMELLDQVLARCEKYGLKLHAKKCQFFKVKVKWCGKVISAAGVSHCPERVQGLVDMQPPKTAGELQQLLCAVNWMRQSIPEYNRLTAGLYSVLEAAMKAAGSRKKAKLAKFPLIAVGWGEEQLADLAAVRDALLHMVPLAHPKPTADVCLYTDASQDYWGAVATQLEPGETQLPLEQQHHRPLAFLSGRFVGAAARWPTIEKEAFAIVEATRRLEYLLLRPGGFRLYTDHRNLVYIFAPYGVDSTMARYQADKLQRWALSLMSFRYVIEHVPGEANAWGDLLSRWGAGPSREETQGVARMSRLAVVERVSPLQEPDFVWPSEDEIRAAQVEARKTDPAEPAGQVVVYDEERKLFVTTSDRVWIPAAASELQQRLCVIAHAGAAGHRGAKTTATALEELFEWPTLRTDVTTFVKECLHCMATASGKMPRPLGETWRATKPNELLHFDFLSMSEGSRGEKYVLVLKDGMSGYVELAACAQATSDEAYQGLIDWFKRFGVVRQWVSDRGAHFKNQVVEKIQRALGAHHHFTTAYTPWANGTVEVVNREVLKTVKALTSERRLRIDDWPSLLPVVQAALNQMPADRLSGATPLTAFTALPGGTQLRSVLHPRESLHAPIEWVENEIREHLKDVRQALDGMHAEMVESSEKRRRAARERVARRQGVVMPRFSEGDFVLAATATGKSGNKLALVWRGPKRIVKAHNDYTFEVQDLVPPFATTIRHAARLQLYRDAARGSVEELEEQAIYGEGGHLVEAIRACRLSPATHQLEVQVKWYGLDEVEVSWEPAEVIQEDVPVLFQRFVDERPEDPDRSRMVDALAELAGRQVAPVAPRVPRQRRGRRQAK